MSLSRRPPISGSALAEIAGDRGALVAGGERARARRRSEAAAHGWTFRHPDVWTFNARRSRARAPRSAAPPAGHDLELGGRDLGRACRRRPGRGPEPAGQELELAGKDLELGDQLPRASRPRAELAGVLLSLPAELSAPLEIFRGEPRDRRRLGRRAVPARRWRATSTGGRNRTSSRTWRSWTR